jgi:hypothetical protein
MVFSILLDRMSHGEGGKRNLIIFFPGYRNYYYFSVDKEMYLGNNLDMHALEQ